MEFVSSTNKANADESIPTCMFLMVYVGKSKVMKNSEKYLEEIEYPDKKRGWP